jgi:ABC-type transporter Mla subunit MlaD
MGLLDMLTGPARALLGGVERAETDAMRHSPLGETRELEAKLGEAVKAAHRAAESLERHVVVIEGLADSLGPLAQAVTRLTDQINELLRVTAPLAAVERDVSRFEHLFGRRRRGAGATPQVEPSGPAEPPAQ